MLNRNFANLMVNSWNSNQYTFYKSIENNDYSTSYATRIYTAVFNITDSISNLASTFIVGTSDEKLTKEEEFERVSLVSPIDRASFTISGSNKIRGNNYATQSKITFTQVWEYTGQEEITINEIGFIVHMQNSNLDYANVLLDRTVLESPITVDSEHSTFTIAFTIGGKVTVTLNS